MSFMIGDRLIGPDQPTYFIADIAANHDGSLARAKELIMLAAEAGADAAKFQNFSATKIVSDYGFRSLGGQQSHQASWKKPVTEVYADASIPDDWTPELKATCDEAGIDYFSAPYDLEAIDMLDPYVPAFKVGSGDITWIESIEAMARKGKPVLIATGAANLAEVITAVDAATAINQQICVMQCNTNYTGSSENLRHINLNVLHTYRGLFPGAVLGLSDHTAGSVTVLGAIALGARMVEKHFTDDTGREGPDHGFSMDPASWRAMVDTARDLEAALGSTRKQVEPNEQQTVVLQRRCLRFARDIPAGTPITEADVEILRPAVPGGLLPSDLRSVLGRSVRADVVFGQEIRWADLA